MGEAVSLLPQNRTVWEETLSLTSAGRRPLPANIIKSVWNPWTCPIDLLPYLAWGLGLEIWDDDWPETRKREVVARIWLLKRRKTTLAGIRDYLDLADAGLVAARRPRDRLFAISTLSDDERAAQMARMPQIHIFPEASLVPVPAGKAFFTRPVLHAFFGLGALVPSDAALRWEQRAVYVDEGKSTPVTVRGLDQALDVGLTVELTAGASIAKAWLNKAWSGAVLVPSDAGHRTIAITPDEAGLSFAVPTGLTPTQVRPQRVAEVAAASIAKTFFSWSHMGTRAVAIPSDADLHVFDQVTLFDPARLAPAHRAISFWGWSRFGLSPYTAELTIDVPLERPTWAFGSFWGLGVWHKTDLGPLWDALEAITIAQAARDDIWVSTKLYEPVQFETGLAFGSFNFGDYRKAT
jgi:hypothetical protein